MVLSIFFTSILSVSNVAYMASASYTGRGYIFTYDSATMSSWFHDVAGYVLDTRDDASLTLPYLWGMNYDAGEYLNNSVDPLCSSLSKASILTISSHGNKGRIVCPDPHSVYAPRITTLSATKSNSATGIGTTTYTRSLNAVSSNLSNIKMVVLDCCYSGATDDYHGNLIEVFEDKGVGSAVGWTGTIPAKDVYGDNHTDYTAKWLSYFFQACYFNHCTTSEAARIAQSRLSKEYENAGDSLTDAISHLSKTEIANPLYVLY